MKGDTNTNWRWSCPLPSSPSPAYDQHNLDKRNGTGRSTIHASWPSRNGRTDPICGNRRPDADQHRPLSTKSRDHQRIGGPCRCWKMVRRRLRSLSLLQTVSIRIHATTTAYRLVNVGCTGPYIALSAPRPLWFRPTAAVRVQNVPVDSVIENYAIQY